MPEPRTRRERLKAESLQRILDAGAARLRTEGLDGAGIGPVMQDAGLTHGAFYSHFGSKEELAVAAFQHAFAENRARWIGKGADRSWPARLARLARRYLTRGHRDDRAASCAFSALAADAARAPAPFRAAYADELRRSLNAICDRPLDAPGLDARSDEAIAVLALCVGGLSLARAVPDEAFSARILAACRDGAGRLGGTGPAATQEEEAKQGRNMP
ncbi:TetR/AcrR family transcriptional regulator [Marinibaculum pumilum]|uniref:TetR/AcrR family transcriptional regulator n=1 Tax=Marinibaculum pumilum TaxID=1766165 RepID=A0ABV7L8V5_9PROT